MKESVNLAIKDLSRVTTNQKEFNNQLFNDILNAIVTEQILIANNSLKSFIENNKTNVIEFGNLLGELDLFKSSIAHEILTCIDEGFGLSEVDYGCDTFLGTECKHSYDLKKYKKKNDSKIHYRWYIKNIKNKTGNISFKSYHNGRTFQASIPYESYVGKKVISIATDEYGYPLKSSPYAKYFY